VKSQIHKASLNSLTGLYRLFFIWSKLTPLNKVLLGKLIVILAGQEIPPPFTEPDGSLPCSQEPTISPYPEPDKSNPYHPTLSLRYILGVFHAIA
jgi:hypothetical protein